MPLIKRELKTLRPSVRFSLVLGFRLTAQGSGKLFVSSHHQGLGA
jgi:hypothetical protein